MRAIRILKAFIYLFFVLFSISVVAEQSPNIRIEPGDYYFNTSFLLPHSSTDLPVEMTISRPRVAHMIGGMDGAIAGKLMILLRYEIEGKSAFIKIWPKNKKRPVSDVKKWPVASRWNYTVKKLAKKAARKYYLADDQDHLADTQEPFLHAKMYSIKQPKKFLAPSSLKTTYVVRNMSMPLRQRRYASIIVEVVINKPHNKNDGMALEALATFRKKEVGKICREFSQIKFKQIKNELREVSRKNIELTSVWDEGVKEVVKRSIRKYLRFQQILTQLPIHLRKDTIPSSEKRSFLGDNGE